MGGRGGKRFVDFGVIRRDRAHSCENRQGGVMAVLEAQSGLRKEQRGVSGRGRQREKNLDGSERGEEERRERGMFGD